MSAPPGGPVAPRRARAGRPPADWTAPREPSLLIGAVLWCADRCARPLSALGVQYPAFRAILQTRLRLDLRSVPFGGQATAGEGTALGLGLILLVCGAWLAGLAPGVMALFGLRPALWMAAVTAMDMALIGFLLFAHYGMLLVDGTDLGVLRPRPVSDRTVFAARLAHALAYVSLLSLAIAFWPLVLGGIGYPLLSVVLVLPVCIAGATLLTVALVGLSYAALLALLGPGRFQRATLALQVAVLSLLMGGWQALIHAPIVKDALFEIWKDPLAVAWLPPLQFGALFETFAADGPSPATIAATAALVLPVVALGLALWLSSRHFLQGLEGGLAGRPSRRSSRREPVFARFGRRLSGSAAEFAGWEFMRAMCRRDRFFVRGGWPTAIGVVVAGLASVVPLTNGTVGIDARWAAFGLYLIAIAPFALLEVSRCSEHPEARWIFDVTPLVDRSAFLRGAARAVLIVAVAPLLLVAATAYALLSGSLLDVLTAVLGASLATLALAPKLLLPLPFTERLDPNRANIDNLGTIFAALGLLVLAGALHAAASLHPVTRVVLPCLLAAALPRAWRGLQRLQVHEGTRRPRPAAAARSASR